MRGVELKVIDAQGEEVPWDEQTVGEIVVRGPTITPGYHKRPEETEHAFRDGWFHTGDLALVNPAGYLTIVDRLKDVINTGGELVYSTEVENVLFAHPAVQETAVIAVPDERWGEAVQAVVVRREDRPCTAADLMSHCRQHLATFKVPHGIDFMAALPKTGSGKIDKKSLREPYWYSEEKRVK